MSRVIRSATRGVPSQRSDRRDYNGPSTGRRDDRLQAESLEEQARDTHEEARMVLPGIQALFGFQLIAVFNAAFFELDAVDRVTHLISLILVAVAIGLIMAPAAHHRLAERDRISSYWIRLASRCIALAMAALMFAIAIDIYLVARMVTGYPVVSIALGISTGAFLAWLWFAMPLLHNPRRRIDGEAVRVTRPSDPPDRRHGR